MFSCSKKEGSSMTDEIYMREALVLAEHGRGRTSPNPLVGAVVVNDNRIVGRGWHHKAGTAHAEVHALADAGKLAKGATVYVTLEPCSHYGRTGPCTEELIRQGVKKVVIAISDPNPLVVGQGLSRLRDAGIEVVEGVLAHEAARQNDIFLKWITSGKPFITLKTAMTLDGKIAAHTGHSRWITGPESRHYVHHLRNQYDAILVGIGTVLADNPQLTVRLPEGGKNPIRIILDSHGRTPLTAHVITDSQATTIIAVTPKAPPKRLQALSQAGAEVLIIPEGPTGIDLQALFSELGKRLITSILVEGGASINGAILDATLADKLYWFIAPKIIGGNNAFSPVGGRGRASMDEALELEETVWQTMGADMLLTAYFTRREGRNVYRTCGRIG